MIGIAADELALNLTNDPDPVRFDGNPPAFKQEKIKLASIGTLTGILSQSIIATTSSPRIYYYLNDHLGTPQLITDENGEVVWKADYMPFGEATVDPASIVNSNFRFPGQHYDQETGLHYNFYRYYDPTAGRYLRPDPLSLSQIQVGRQSLRENLGRFLLNPSNESEIQSFFISEVLYHYGLTSPQVFNPYRYASNSPIRYADPAGLWGFDIGFTGGAGRAAVNVGIYIGSSGVFFYYGFGFGGGAGISATVTTATVSSGVNVSGTARGGTGTWGGFGNVSVSTDSGKIKSKCRSWMGYWLGLLHRCYPYIWLFFCPRLGLGIC